jgi:ATP-dependent helicase/DNAse subunit B
MLTLLLGPARCGKTARLLRRYRVALREQPPGTTLWLAPTWRAAAEVRGRLFDGRFGGCLSPGVMTFEQFAETVLDDARLPIRPMTRLMKRELVRQIIGTQAAAGRLKHFQSIATTGGLVDLVCEFISELKRLEIWPEEFHRACVARGLGDKDVELSEIYAAYQQTLREHGLFDAEGRFWSARDVLQKAEGGRGLREAQSSRKAEAPSPLLSPLILDGFTDFTRTQHEIIEILARRAEATIVALPLEPEPRRADLFAKPLGTLAEFRRRHGNLAVEEIDRPATSYWPAMAHLERSLFVSAREQGAGVGGQGSGGSTEPPVAGLEILAAARQVGEIELIATRIKRLLMDGQARPGEIAVVFRSPQAVDGLVGEVFGRLSVPVMFESGETLDRSPALRALVAIAQLDLDDWPFAQLLTLLGSNYFQPTWREWQEGRAAVHVERTIRRLQIPRGREALLGQLAGKDGNPSGHTSLEDAARRIALAVAQGLARALDGLPRAGTLAEWARAWQRLAAETGLLRAMKGAGFRGQRSGRENEASAEEGQMLPPAPLLFDRRAWDRLMEVLAAADTLAGWLQQSAARLDRRAAVETLSDILRSERVGPPGDESGYVRILSASSIRALRIPHLFLVGLSEKVFPLPQRDDRLYSDSEYGRLIEAGLPFVARSERTREEMLLFYEAITRAERRLYLSYPALDEAAQPLLASPFLQEVDEAMGPGRISRTEQSDLRPIPPDDDPPSEAEFRVKALATALEGNVNLLAGLFDRGETPSPPTPLPKGEGRQSRSSPLSPLSANLAAGLEMIHLRQDRDRFGPAEGILPSREAHYYLLGRFPQHHIFAATDLERYAACPYRFFLERVLEIAPLEDLTLAFDVRNRGRSVHDVLAAFHRRVNERLGRPASPLELDAAEFDALLAAAVEEVLPAEPENSLATALREVDRRLVVQWLSQYHQQLEKYAALWQDFETPMATELMEASFGRPGPPPSTDQWLEFSRDQQMVRISGRIDRVDTGTVAGHNVFNVLDYKTGGPITLTPESVTAGLALQPPLYALAVMELLLVDRNLYPWQAGYWYIREGGFRPRQALRMYRNDDGRIELEPAWETLRATLGDTVVTLVNAIRHGRFPVYGADERCTGYCPLSTVCRINQVRSLEKTCQPTAGE